LPLGEEVKAAAAAAPAAAVTKPAVPHVVGERKRGRMLRVQEVATAGALWSSPLAAEVSAKAGARWAEC
jgi:hypothetical protein